MARLGHTLNITGEADSPALFFDAETYRQQLSEFELNEDQEKKILQALWSVLISIIDVKLRIQTNSKIPDRFGIDQVDLVSRLEEDLPT